MARNFKKRFFLLRLLGKVSLLTLLAVLLPYHFASAVAPQPTKKVLLLYSYQAVLPANVEWDTGIREALAGKASVWEILMGRGLK